MIASAAAEEAVAKVNDRASVTQIEEIFVTARRRSESLQNVPLSVSAFSGDQLEQQGMTTLSDLQHAIPGLQYSNRGYLQTEMTIRGIGGDARNVGIDSGVGMYVDGVYVARSSGYNADLSEVEHLEVLRGPQGTLFGKNTIGGVINIITKKPSEEVTGFVNASFGKYNALRTQASVSGPLGQNFYGKITTATWNRDGYLHNIFDGLDYNNENRRGGRLQLRWLPTDKLELNLNADVTQDRRRAVLNQMGSAKGAAAAFYTGDRFQLNTDQRNSDSRDMWGTSLTADYKLDNNAVLTSITAYKKINILVYSDIDQTPNDLFHSGPFTDRSQMFTQELRYVSSGSEAFRYVGGLYYYYQNVKGERFISILNNPALKAYNNAAAKTNSFAGYLNADYDILQNLTLTGGIRYTYEKKDGSYLQTRAGLNYNFPSLERTDKNLSWTASLDYKITPNATAYVTVSKGFKSGGFNLDTLSSPNLIATDISFNPESVINYEAGLKGRALDGKLHFSGAVFDMEYKNKQVSQFVGTGATVVPSIQVTNAGAARIQGFELETTIKPVSGLTLSGNAAYLHARYTSFENAAKINNVFVSFTDHVVERTPKWTAGASAEYRFPLEKGDMVVMGNMTYTGETYLQPDNFPANFEPGYTLFDARIGYQGHNGMSVFLWGKNLSNKGYRIYSRQFAGLDQVVFGEPRFYGIDFSYHF
jgi:iron complex outermembrane receptor protein